MMKRFMEKMGSILNVLILNSHYQNDVMNKIIKIAIWNANRLAKRLLEIFYFQPKHRYVTCF